MRRSPHTPRPIPAIAAPTTRSEGRIHPRATPYFRKNPPAATSATTPTINSPRWPTHCSRSFVPLWSVSCSTGVSGATAARRAGGGSGGDHDTSGSARGGGASCCVSSPRDSSVRTIVSRCSTRRSSRSIASRSSVMRLPSWGLLRRTRVRCSGGSCTSQVTAAASQHPVGRAKKPTKRVSRSVGFAICSPRGMGDPARHRASGFIAPEFSSQYAAWCEARKRVGVGLAPGGRRSRRGELRLLLGRERVLDLDQQGDVGALHLALHPQHLVHLRRSRHWIDRRLLEQRGEPLGLVLHAPLQVHHLGLEILDRLGDDGALLGAEPEVLLVLHDQFRWEQDARQRVVGLWGLGLRRRGLLGCRADREQDEGRHEREAERFHGVLRSKVMVTRPSSGTVRSSSSFGSASRKSVGVFKRAVARSLDNFRRMMSTAIATLAMTAAAATSPTGRCRAVAARRARAALSVARNDGATPNCARRSASNRCSRS